MTFKFACKGLSMYSLGRVVHCYHTHYVVVLHTVTAVPHVLFCMRFLGCEVSKAKFRRGEKGTGTDILVGLDVVKWFPPI